MPQTAHILDTNVLLHDARALERFPNSEVIITLDVLEELDTFKSAKNDLGRCARQSVRYLDEIRKKGSLVLN